MFFCNVRICHMNAERSKSGQIFHCKHSFFKAPSNPTWHKAHTCPAEHRAPRSGGKHKASQPVSTLQLLLCLWASLCLSKIRGKSGQPECSPGTITVLEAPLPWNKTPGASPYELPEWLNKAQTSQWVKPQTWTLCCSEKQLWTHWDKALLCFI